MTIRLILVSVLTYFAVLVAPVQGQEPEILKGMPGASLSAGSDYASSDALPPDVIDPHPVEGEALPPWHRPLHQVLVRLAIGWVCVQACWRMESTFEPTSRSFIKV
ncbi:MAG: hypothetical protein WCJ40_19965 [Planctomycetota bacterium]